MDFNDTPEEAAFRTEARAWLDANAEPLAPGEARPTLNIERGRAGAIEAAQAWMAKKADGGWACITWPAEYGGRGATRIQNVIWGQEEARYRVPLNLFTIGQGMLGPTLMAHGTDQQKDRYLRKMLRADEIWCQLFSEPAAGSDLAGLRMTSRRDGDEWVIDGQKIWTSGAHYAQLGMIVTRSDADAQKHAGLTYFIVDMKAPGVEIRPIKQMNGAAGFNEVFFSDVRVPDSWRVGEVGDGWSVALTTLMNERAAIGGGGGGGPDWSDLVELARRSPGTRAGTTAYEESAVRQELADFFVRMRGVKLTGDRTLTALSRGETPGPQSSLSKLVAARLRQRMASLAVDLQGAAGGMMDADVEGTGAWPQAYLGAPGGRLAGGTDEILRNIIAERVLRLPPEVRLDKGKSFREIPSGPPAK